MSLPRIKGIFFRLLLGSILILIFSNTLLPLTQVAEAQTDYSIFKRIFYTDGTGETGVINNTSSGLAYIGTTISDDEEVGIRLQRNVVFSSAAATGQDTPIKSDDPEWREKLKIAEDYVAGDNSGILSLYLIRIYKDTGAATPQSADTVLYNANTAYVASIQHSVEFLIKDSKFLPNTNYKADFWYCAGRTDTADGTDAYEEVNTPTVTDPQIQVFSGRCSGTAYFQIGDTISFSTGQKIGAAGSGTTGRETITVGGATTENTLPSCGFINGSIMGCVAKVVYYLIFKPAAFFAWLMGNIFDFFLGYSINDEAYRHNFITDGWALVRDIANIFFIIILIYTAIATVFGANGVSYKAIIPSIIINALLINFSLFATRVIIDLSNITARVFYNQMEVCDGECRYDQSGTLMNPTASPLNIGYTPISASIVSSFNPQRIFQTAVLRPSAPSGSGEEQERNSDTNFNAQGFVSQSENVSALDPDSSEYAGYFLLVTLGAAIIVFFVGLMFWKVGFIFLERVIQLYISMLFSAFAFLTRGNIPFASKIKMISWRPWIGNLVRYAFVAPIFVFFLFVIYKIMNISFFTELGLEESENFFVTLLYVMIPMLIVYGLMNAAKKIAEEYSGAFSNGIMKAVGTIGGIAGGAALGGAALLGRNVIGRAVTQTNKGQFADRLRDSAAKGNWLAKVGVKALNYGEKASFDARNVNAIKNLGGKLGMDFDKYVGRVGLGTRNTAGGYVEAVKQRQERREKEAELYKTRLTDEDVESYNKKQKEKYQERRDDAAEEILRSTGTYTNQRIEEMRKTDKIAFENALTAALSNNPALQAKLDEVEKAKEKASVAEINTERRKAYAERLKRGEWFTGTRLYNALQEQVARGGIGGALAGLGAAGLGAAGISVQAEGDKNAAKKVGDVGKVEKELADIQETLQTGFENLVAIETFTSKYGSLTPEDRDQLLLGRSQLNLTPAERATMEQKIKAMTKEQKSNYEGSVRELQRQHWNAKEKEYQGKKGQKGKIQQALEDWKNNPGNKDKFDEYMRLLSEWREIKKEKNKWNDIEKYRETQKKKMSGNTGKGGSKKK